MGVWHHLCMVYDAAESCITLYADGVPGEPKTIAGTFRPYIDGGVEVGRPGVTRQPNCSPQGETMTPISRSNVLGVFFWGHMLKEFIRHIDTYRIT